jgi:hypothetical protein
MQLVPVYLPNVAYMAEYIAQPTRFTLLGNYQKQTFRNRCSIFGANGKLNLIIPVEHNKKKHISRTVRSVLNGMKTGKNSTGNQLLLLIVPPLFLSIIKMS